MQSVITSRIDDDRKLRMEQICDQLGISVAGAISIFSNAFINHGGFPFDVRIATAPNYDARLEKLMDEADEFARSHSRRLSHDEVFNHAREQIHVR